MLTFKLHRDEDVSGTSGTGFVAEGVQFTDGTVVLRWTTKLKSTAIYGSVTEMMDIHGHGGKTTVVWDTPFYPYQPNPSPIYTYCVKCGVYYQMGTYHVCYYWTPNVFPNTTGGQYGGS